MSSLRLAALCVLPFALATSVGCRQLMKGADEALEVGRRVDLPTPRMPDAPAGGVAGRIVKSAIQVGAEEAVKLAAEHGASVGADLPSLGGKWEQKDSLGDGMHAKAAFERTTLRPGVYAMDYHVDMTLDGLTLMTMHSEIVEVISATRQCQWANSLRIDYASVEIQQLLEAGGGVPTIDDFNQDPCGELKSVEANQVIGVDEDGVTFIERRVP